MRKKTLQYKIMRFALIFVLVFFVVNFMEFFASMNGVFADNIVYAVEDTTETNEQDWLGWAAGGIWSGFLAGVRVIVSGLIWFLATLIISFLGAILAIILNLLFLLMGYNGFVTNESVVIGWTVIRDVANMFFVVIMLAIAIATILRIESYNYKRLLPKLLIMAVLVNFSRTICGLIIDAGQVVMMTFAASLLGNDGAGLSTIFSGLRITEFLSAGVSENTNLAEEGLSSLAGAISGILAVILMFIAVISVGIYLGVIVVRIIMLWILVVLSPFAFLLAAFPQGEQYAQRWWQQFVRNVIVGPLIAFFLWLTFVMINASNGAIELEGVTVSSDPSSFSVQQAGEDKVLTYQPKEIFTNVTPENLVSYVLAIGMLMGGLYVTSQLGVAGSEAAGRWFNKLKSAGSIIGTSPLRLPGLINRKLGAGKVPGFRWMHGKSLNPLDFYEGWKQTQENIKSKEIGDRKAFAGAKFRENMEKNHGLRAIFGLAMGSSADASEAFLQGPLAGPKAIWQAVRSGKISKDLAGKIAVHTENKERMEELQELVDTPSLDEAGKAQLIKETAERMNQELKSGNNAVITKVNPDGSIAGRGINQADLDDLMQTITPEQLEEMGLSGVVKGNIGSDGKARPGIDASSPADRDIFTNEFLKYHASKMVNEMGKYEDLNTGLVENITSGSLEDAGRRYYAEQAADLATEKSRIASGGIGDFQLEMRQNELENINRQMLAVLKQIELRGDKKATLTEANKLEELQKEGLILGGQLTATGYKGISGAYANVFSVNPNSDETQKLTHGNITTTSSNSDIRKANAERLKKERELLDEQKYLDKLNRKESFLSEVSALSRNPDFVNKKKDYQAELEKQKKLVLDSQAEVSKKSYTAPAPYYAMQAYRALENEEMSKLPDEMEYSEIDQALRQAERERDFVKFTTLLKKAAQDGNDNEWLQSYGFSQTDEGMRKFGEEYMVKKMGMNRQLMLQTMQDIGYVNESVGHYGTARMVEVKNGAFQWLKPKDHAATIAHEMSKKEARALLQRTNRLGYGGEDINGHFKLSMHGKIILSALEDQIQYRIPRGEFNPSALSKIAEDIAGLNEMVSRGLISSKTKSLILSYAKRGRTQASYQSFSASADKLE